MWQILGSLKPPTYLQYHTHTQNARQTCVSWLLSVPSVSYRIVDLIINKFAHIGEHVVTPRCSQLRQMWKWNQQGRLHLYGFRLGGHSRAGRSNKSTIAVHNVVICLHLTIDGCLCSYRQFFVPGVIFSPPLNKQDALSTWKLFIIYFISTYALLYSRCYHFVF